MRDCRRISPVVGSRYMTQRSPSSLGWTKQGNVMVCFLATDVSGSNFCASMGKYFLPPVGAVGADVAGCASAWVGTVS